MKRKQISISIRELVEFILRTGDISPTEISPNRAVDGTKAHQWVQKNSGDNYIAEVNVSLVHACKTFDLLLRGRIDGVIKQNNTIIINEIKSTTRNLEKIEEPINIHLAQAQIYAYIYCQNNDLDYIKVKLTYVLLENYELKHFDFEYTKSELELIFIDIISKYEKWANMIIEWEKKKLESIRIIEFPYGKYRKGQKKLLNSVYKTILENKQLYVRAPTGIGKTIGTIFPTLKALQKENKIKQIFYLTAKTIGREVAEKAFILLAEKGLLFRTLTLTAKDKICLCDKTICDPNICPYAKDYYSKINDTLWAIINSNNTYSRETIIEYAKKYVVCPFELQLDIALFSDAIICDYNYVFDPSAMLKRFFTEKGEYVLLIDEAHNLVDRAREMYSATIEKKEVLKVKSLVKNQDEKLVRYLNKLNKVMLEKQKEMKIIDKENDSDKLAPDEMVDLSRGIIHRIEYVLVDNKSISDKDIIMDFYFKLYDFVKKAEVYDNNYVTYFSLNENNLMIKLYCINPSYLIKQSLEKVKAAIFFSATLIPLDYYVKILGGDSSSYGLSLSSPFEQEKLCLIINNSISTKYKDRENTYDEITNIIYESIKIKKGNYLIFFPSYAYMEEIATRLTLITSDCIDMIKQKSEMLEEERVDFLNCFTEKNKKTLVGLAVLGGIFGEGIDLVGERLNGVIVIGVGLPGICYERDLIKAFYSNSYEGFCYAYMYPGINKVFQAVGRVIRTEEDQGMVILIDERFGERSYYQLFPQEWSHRKYVNNIDSTKDILSNREMKN